MISRHGFRPLLALIDAGFAGFDRFRVRSSYTMRCKSSRSLRTSLAESIELTARSKRSIVSRARPVSSELNVAPCAHSFRVSRSSDAKLCCPRDSSLLNSRPYSVIARNCTCGSVFSSLRRSRP